MAMNVMGALEAFQKSQDPAATAEKLDKYLQRVELMFDILPTTVENPLNDKKKKAYLRIWGGEDLIYI